MQLLATRTTSILPVGDRLSAAPAPHVTHFRDGAVTVQQFWRSYDKKHEHTAYLLFAHIQNVF